jgi:vesicle coat complex subunit
MLYEANYHAKDNHLTNAQNNTRNDHRAETNVLDIISGNIHQQNNRHNNNQLYASNNNLTQPLLNSNWQQSLTRNNSMILNSYPDTSLDKEKSIQYVEKTELDVKLDKIKELTRRIKEHKKNNQKN